MAFVLPHTFTPLTNNPEQWSGLTVNGPGWSHVHPTLWQEGRIH